MERATPATRTQKAASSLHPCAYRIVLIREGTLLKRPRLYPIGKPTARRRTA